MRLTYKQFISIILICGIITNFIIIPYISLNIASILIGLMLVFIYTGIYFSFKSSVKVNNKYIRCIMALKFIINAGLITAIFYRISSDIFLKNTNQIPLLVIILLSVVYCSINLKCIGTISRVLYIFILIPIISVIIFSVNDIKLNNIYSSISSIKLIDIFSISLVSMIFEIVLILSEYVDFNITLKKIMTPVSFSIGLVLLSSFCLIGRFGNSAFNYPYPAFELMYSSDLPGYLIQRQEGILISVLLLGLLVTISLLIGLSYNFINSSLKISYNYILYFIISIAAICIKDIFSIYIIFNFFTGIIFVIISVFLKGNSNEK